MLTVIAAGWLLAQVAATPATQAAPAPVAAAADARSEKPKKPKLICTEETPVGSVIAKRTCRTPEQAEAERPASRRAADAMLDHLSTCRGPAC